MAGSGYYQVGGWRGHINAPPGAAGFGSEKPLAAALLEERSPLRPWDVKQGPVELVLGIRRSGASCLLMTAAEASKYGERYQMHIRKPAPLQASDFVSLSPIRFEAVEELKRKLMSLSPKKGRADRDMSQANVIYVDEFSSSSSKEPEGISRGEYELNRVFHRFAKGEWIKAKYSLPEDWRLPRGTRVCTFTFSVFSKQYDTRSDSERLDNPRILDVAFAEADAQSLELQKDTLQYFVVKENSQLGSHSFRTVVDGIMPETLPLNEIGRRVSTFFNQGSGPILLVVYDKNYTRSVLRKLGCHAPEGASMREVFLPLAKTATSSARDRWNPHRGPRNEDRSSNRRSRSRSPARSGDPRRRAPDSRRESRDDAPVRQSVYADVHELYHKMSTMHSAFGTRPLEISGSLGVYQRRGLAEWGASLEVGVLFDCWKAMASGPPIDEQRARLSSLSSGSSAPAPPAHAATPAPEEDDEYDEDRDPNEDIAEIQAATAIHQASVRMKSYTQDPDYLSDDEDEY